MDDEFLTPLAVPTPLQNLLNQFGAWGAMVEHRLFALPPTVDVMAHYRAALSALELVRLYSVAWSEKNGHRVPPIVIDFDKIAPKSGRRIEPAQFFGPWFDLETRTPFLRGTTKNHLNHLFAFDTEETSVNATRGREQVEEWSEIYEEEGDFVRRGYTDALFDPPYSLRGPRLPLGQTFLALCDELFGDLTEIEVMA